MYAEDSARMGVGTSEEVGAALWPSFGWGSGRQTALCLRCCPTTCTPSCTSLTTLWPWRSTSEMMTMALCPARGTCPTSTSTFWTRWGPSNLSPLLNLTSTLIHCHPNSSPYEPHFCPLCPPLLSHLHPSPPSHLRPPGSP